MMTFRVRLKKATKLNQPRLRVNFEKLRDPDVACTLGAPLIGLRDEDMDINTMITASSHDAASEILRGNVAAKSHGSPKIFLSSVITGEI